MCFMENYWLLPHRMWQLCYIPNQHHHLLHQCCEAQCEEILRAGIKCCQSNLDQAQFSGLNIPCKYLLFLKIWKSRFWAALTSALLQRAACAAWKLGLWDPKRHVDDSTRYGGRIDQDTTSPMDSSSVHPELLTEKRVYLHLHILWSITTPFRTYLEDHFSKKSSNTQHTNTVEDLPFQSVLQHSGPGHQTSHPKTASVQKEFFPLILYTNLISTVQFSAASAVLSLEITPQKTVLGLTSVKSWCRSISSLTQHCIEPLLEQ